jgi:Spy/CpxP family protein refolding chaperone
MKSMHFKTLTAAVALLACSVSTPVFSQTMDKPMREHHEGHGQMMEMEHMNKMGDMMGMCTEHGEKLGLSDAQLLKIKPVQREMQKKQVRIKADLKIAEIELMEILEVKDFDLEKSAATVKKIAEILTTQHLEMLKSMKEMRATLTDEQFKNMKKMMPMKPGDKKHEKKMNKKSSKTNKGEDK